MKTIVLKAVLLSMVTTGIALGAKPIMITPDSLKWQSANGLKGAEVAIISGNPEKNEPFTARVKLPANYEVPVHMHHIVENDTIISGTLYVGIGDQINKDTMHALPAGSVLMIPARLKHYAFTKEETILQISGIGPWGMVYKKTH